MSNLSDLIPAGASGKTIEAVATATIASKAPVILNSAGTVTEVSATTGTLAAGTAVQFTSGSAQSNSIAFDSSSNTVVLVTCDYGASGYGQAYVGTVSGTTISYAAPVTFNSGFTSQTSTAFDSDSNKVVVAWRDDSSGDDGFCVVGTVSGTTISFGTENNFSGTNAARMTATSVVFDSNSNKIVICYSDQGNSYYPTAIVGTISGTTISFGTKVQGASSAAWEVTATFDSTSNQVVMFYRDDGNSDYPTAVVATVSGTSISFGTAVVAESLTLTTYGKCIGYHPVADKVLVAYTASSDASAAVGTVSGTSISFGTVVTDFTGENANAMEMTYESLFESMVISYSNAQSSRGEVIQATISGTVPTFGTPITFETDNVSTERGIATCFDSSNNKVVTLFTNVTSSSDGEAVVITPGGTLSNVTAANFLGIADAGISTSATGTIVVQGGTVTGMSSLTTGGKYYVQNDGTITSPDGPIAYTIAGASYDSVSFDVTQDSTITGMCFNNDGTKMYVCGENTDTVYQYSLSSAYDLSTASYDSVSLDVSGQINPAPRSVVFNNDGSALYVCGPDQGVFQYTVSTPYDLSTASYSSKTFSVASQELYPCGLIFNNDGASMYVVGSQNKTVYQYTLSTPFDVSTASYASKSMSVTSEQSSPTGLAFNSDGTKIFVIGETTPKINQYSLSSAYDASTGSYDSVSYTYSEGTVPRDIVFNSTGLKFFIPDSGPDDIYQYTVGGGATSSVNAGLAISTTSLLLNGDS